MKTILQLHTAEKLIGKTIFWQVPGYKKLYVGIAKIVSVDTASRKPIKAKTVQGDDLSFAFVNQFNEEDKEFGLLSYSDGNRYVTFTEVEENATLPTGNFL